MKHTRLRMAAIALGAGAWLVYLVLAALPEVADAVAGVGPIPWIRRGLSQLSGLAPFSLVEFVIAGVLLRQVLGVTGGVRAIRSGKAGLLPTLASGGLRFGADVGVLVFLFYLLWGFQYARPSFEDHLGIEPAGEAGVDELRRLATLAVRRTNEAYVDLHGLVDISAPTPTPDIPSLVPALEEGWASVVADYDLPDRVSGEYGGPKSFLSSGIVKRLGVAGMHFPYTGEALVLADLPGVDIGQSLAHEMAHQRGFASESDANALSFLVGRASPDPFVRYAAYSFLDRQLVAALQRVSRDAAREVTRGRLPGVVRDLSALSDYWRPAQNPVSRAASRVNDRMLRSHGIPEGVASYAGSTWVFIALARERGEDALF